MPGVGITGQEPRARGGGGVVGQGVLEGTGGMPSCACLTNTLLHHFGSSAQPCEPGRWGYLFHFTAEETEAPIRGSDWHKPASASISKKKLFHCREVSAVFNFFQRGLSRQWSHLHLGLQGSKYLHGEEKEKSLVRVRTQGLRALLLPAGEPETSTLQAAGSPSQDTVYGRGQVA